MRETEKLNPCSHCRSPHLSVKKQSGRVGITKTSYYRETIKCKSCKIEVSAGTPGNAVKFWNRSYDGLTAVVTEDQIKRTMESARIYDPIYIPVVEA